MNIFSLSDEVQIVEPADDDGKRLTRINNESLTDDIGGVDACQVRLFIATKQLTTKCMQPDGKNKYRKHYIRLWWMLEDLTKVSYRS